ncbi:hypothetical protein GUITHDRAFT_148301 [Guillardia theta CCMP2712]|uniref:Uncharacterized protein n=1 Tax=Guillardia theta (strain CCMP2712) TaxID=905079 RepID=L1IAG1_GUITC|nr:hypothetical protein GUITHDRAFT_148301 [Guillardia theta CCMP2712]EKX32884.1 hypothetical protein GUITHDRAFT_148301 [Guillardia theta CCMP2712]|eukprot:XP_005819864.1 hypothetical protein GUITHDRAFT_148301 [Guillardia theta CCMP2712]
MQRWAGVAAWGAAMVLVMMVVQPFRSSHPVVMEQAESALAQHEQQRQAARGTMSGSVKLKSAAALLMGTRKVRAKKMQVGGHVAPVAPKSKQVHKKLSGKKIFARMMSIIHKNVAGQKKHMKAPPAPADIPVPKSAKMRHGRAISLKQILEEDNADAEKEGKGRRKEVKTNADEITTFILAGGFGVEDVKYIEGASDADIRMATWDKDCKAIIFPPLHDIPDFGPNAVKDLRAFASHGMHHSGTILFMGSSVEVHIINDVFGYELEQDFKPGPYYKNERGVLGTALQDLPDRVNELGNTESLGVLKSSMPPESRSYYDSFGDSVAFCVRYDLGRVCYLAQDFKLLERMPQLQVELAESEDEELQIEAERELEALGRKTDTWLAIMEGMLLTPEISAPEPVKPESD